MGSLVYGTAVEGERYASLMDYAGIVWRRAWVVALVALVFAGAAVGASMMQTPTYEASAKLLVGQKAPTDPEAAPTSNDLQGLQPLTQTMTVAVASRPVAGDAASALGSGAAPEQILANLTVEQVDETQFIQITYTGTDPDGVRETVNAVANAAAGRISSSEAGASIITASVWEGASTPQSPVSPDPLRNGLLALGLGLMLGVGVAFLLENLDDGWRSVEEIEEISGVPNFGVVPVFGSVRAQKG